MHRSCFSGNLGSMTTTFKDFVAWAGGQRKAAALIGVDKYRAHRLFHNPSLLLPEEAMRIELATGGAFRKEALIFGHLIGKSSNG